MAEAQFGGDKKEGRSLLYNAEERLKAVLLPHVPHGVETYHLTLTTVLWSILVIFFCWLATYNRQWMWGVSLMVASQYITDLLDGAIGRKRNTGLIKWGFYMDHFLDYIFLCALLIGYSLLMPNDLKVIMFFIMAVIGAFMVNSFLQFAATNKFRISYWGIGPTEIRLIFILINTLIIYVNQVLYVQALPYILCVAVFGLFFTVYNTQRDLWRIDMENKASSEGRSLPSLGEKKSFRVKRFRTLAVVALVLAVCTWAGMKLLPVDRDIDFLLGPEGTIRIQKDSQTIRDAQLRIREIQSAPLTEASLLSWLRIQIECRELMENYRAYGRLDFHEYPGRHTDAFLIEYAAMALHRAGVLDMVEKCSPGQLQFLDQAHPQIGVSANTFTRWKKDLIKPDTLLKFGFSASYIQLLGDQIDVKSQPDSRVRRQALEAIAQQNTEKYYRMLKDLPGAL